jgi:hypothetical protein
MASVQTYGKEVRAGHFVMMKDPSAPVIMKGQDWGELSLACRMASHA